MQPASPQTIARTETSLNMISPQELVREHGSGHRSPSVLCVAVRCISLRQTPFSLHRYALR
jgi:hypothetical protein